MYFSKKKKPHGFFLSPVTTGAGDGDRRARPGARHGMHGDEAAVAFTTLVREPETAPKILVYP